VLIEVFDGQLSAMVLSSFGLFLHVVCHRTVTLCRNNTCRGYCRWVVCFMRWVSMAASVLQMK
jgi:hypothetical protein